MMNTLTQDVGLAAYTGPWKNLLFLKNGHTVMGANTFPTREAAALAASEGEQQLRSWLALGLDVRVVRRREGGRLMYTASQYSHCIQVPGGAA